MEDLKFKFILEKLVYRHFGYLRFDAVSDILTSLRTSKRWHGNRYFNVIVDRHVSATKSSSLAWLSTTCIGAIEFCRITSYADIRTLALIVRNLFITKWCAVALTKVVLRHYRHKGGGAVIKIVLILFWTTVGCVEDKTLQLFLTIVHTNAHCTIVLSYSRRQASELVSVVQCHIELRAVAQLR